MARPRRNLKSPRQLSSIQLTGEQDDPSDIHVDLSETGSFPLQAISNLDESHTRSRHSQSKSQSNSQSPSLGEDDCEYDSPLMDLQMDHMESQNVTRWKTFVMTLLLINAGLVTISTFEILRREEEAQFETAFFTAASTLSDASHYHAEALLDTLQTFSQTVTSYAIDTQVQWPFLTVPHFEQRASILREKSFLSLFAMAPFVTQNQTQNWELYSTHNQHSFSYK